MVNVNRSIGPGWNIWSDLNDSLSQRDTGWIQFYASSNQEIFDNIIQAYKIAENEDVYLPAMISYDGFILSHTSMPLDVPNQSMIDKFLPDFKPGWTLDVKKPITHGNIVPPKPYMDIRYSMETAMKKAKKIIEEVGEEYGKKFGRPYDLVQEYRCDDADYVFVTMAALAAEAKVAVDSLRDKGEKVGVVNLRTVRPFPYSHLTYDNMIVIDRDISPGLGGIIYHEMKKLKYCIYSFIAGVGGVDVGYKDIERIYQLAQEEKEGWYPLEVK